MNGLHNGLLTIEGRFDGMLNGTGIVPAGASAEIAGMVNGALLVERDAAVTVSGMINGQIIDRGGKIVVTGMAGQIVTG